MLAKDILNWWMASNISHTYSANEFKRKKIHLFSFIIPLWYIFFPLNISIFTSIILSLVLFIDLSRLYTNIKINNFFNFYLSNTIRNYEKKQLLSATYLIISFFFIVHFFENNIAIYSMSFASICDASAAIIGIKYGRILNHLNKSIEGSLAFLVTGLFIILAYSSILYIDIDIIYLIICIFLVTLVEFFTPSKYDNISVPFSSAIILTGLSILWIS